MAADQLYHIVPVPLQNLGISLYGLYWKYHRMGGIFSTSFEEANLREFYTYHQWEEYQTKELRSLLLHAYDTVQFYREKYSQYGISREFLAKITLGEIKKLPFLTKEEFRKFGRSSLLSSKRGRGIYSYSSGSTGTPTAIYVSRHFHQKYIAIYEARNKKWAGVRKGMARGMIGGRRILPESELKAPYYRYNLFERQTYFSAYHLNPGTVQNYIEGMRKYKVEYMMGYAMSLFFMAEFIEMKNLKVPRMKAVLSSSEKLTTGMRSVIEKVFQCKVFDGYSGSEFCGLIAESPKGELLVNPDVGIMEFILEDGGDTSPGEIGEIVSTGFLNYDQPLIRYKIGDRALLSSNQDTITDHNMLKVEEIVGRIEDVIELKDGRKIVRFHALYLDIEGLVVAQIEQHDYDIFSFNLVCDQSFNRVKSERIIRARLESQVGKSKVDFNYFDALPVEKNGKIKAVISYLHSK